MRSLRQPQNKEDPSQSQAQDGQNVAGASIKRKFFGRGDFSRQISLGQKLRAGQDAAIGVDKSADSRRRGAEKETSVFDSSENGDQEMLVGSRAFPIPAVVGNGHQEFGASFDKFSNQAGKNDLIANRGAEFRPLR
jgi:hypothetical protein